MKKIIYLAGSSRSGTTFFDAFLGSHEGVISVGELRHIMQRSFLWNEYCSCGQKFFDCSFWSPIAKQFLEKFNPREILEIRKQFELPASYLRILLGFSPDKEKLNKLREAYWFILNKVFEQTGAEFIVDSSKVPIFAYLIYKDSPFEVYYVHVTREPQGVVYSMSKKKKRFEKNPEVKESPEFMRRLPKPLGFSYWALRNIESFLFIKYFKNVYFLKYADFSNKNLLESFLGELSIPKKIRTENSLHIISGNPSRFKKEFLTFRYDDKWKEKLSALEKVSISLFGSPINYLLAAKEKQTKKKLGVID